MDISQRKTDNEVIYGDGKFIIRLRSTNETEETFYNLIDKEQWGITLAKVKAFYDTFPTSTFITINEETKEVIAVSSVTPAHPGHSILGNVVVKYDYRKQGHAMRLLKTVIDKHAHNTINLIAFPGTEPMYSKLGFRVIAPLHRMHYIEVDRVKVDQAYSEHNVDDDISIECYTKEMFPALHDYDTNARGYDCKKYLSVMTSSSSLFLVATSKTSGQVVGYSAGVEETKLLWVEAMYADSDIIALCIFRKMLEAFPQKTQVRIQTIKPREFLVGFGKILPKSLIINRMSTGPAAKVSLSKLYAVADYNYAE